LSNEEKAYIAGFLDGDGSIIAQLVHRKDYRLGYQIRVSVVFYQKTTHQEFLLWLKKQLGFGYIRARRDGMTEYTIVGLREVEYVLTLLHPFLRLKKSLARDVLKIIKIHPEQRKMTKAQLIKLSALVDKTASFNYSKKRTITSAKVITFLERQKISVPVETESVKALIDEIGSATSGL
jgi:intein-encoded DNA endonuclease-like protein